jgi:uncharacterized protein involved in exopolysaccharide biosynthesis
MSKHGSQKSHGIARREDTRTFTLVPESEAALTARDLMKPVFRYRRAAIACFLVLTGVVAIGALLWPKKYTAEMKIVVKRERVDPLVTAGPDAGQQRTDVSDTELNSEVELLKSRDLLEATVAATGLVRAPAQADSRGRQLATARAIVRLERALTIAPVRKTTLIRVTYTDTDPVRAKTVLTELSRRYLEKHLIVNRPAGARQFFADQATRLERQLRDAEQRLVRFGRTAGVVAASAERDAALQRLAQFEGSLEDLHAQAADATRRIEVLGQQLRDTPERQITELRTSDNGELMRDLKSKVLELELKRTDLAQKYNDSYPLIVEVDQQLRQARAALANAERAPVKAETTNQNPTHQWIRGELSRVTAEREALQARGTAVGRSIGAYRERVRQLDGQSATEQDLQRGVKAAEENFLLYQRKAEEARIADALDRTRIANVAVAEEATVPVLPASRLKPIAAGLLGSAAVSLLLTFLLQFLNPCFRSREELWSVLELPVLAALPPAD